MDQMAPFDLRAITLSLSGTRGTGRRSRFARLLGWGHSTVWRKLNGKGRITESVTLAIERAEEMAAGGALKLS